MCNAYGNRISYRTYVEAFDQRRIPVTFPHGPPNLEPRDMIRPTDPAPIIRPTSDGAGFELVEVRWGFPPSQPKGGPVINFRSEGRQFGPGRCLVPASHFFEYTGTRSPKTKWRFTMVGQDWFCFAGLWRRAPGPDGPIDHFTLLTCEPGADVKPIHDRQPVVLRPGQWADWLNPRAPSAPLLQPSPAGTLAVEQA